MGTIPPPTYYTATATTSTSITLNWEPDSNATSWLIYYATNIAFEDTVSVDVNETNAVSYTLTGLITGTHYYFKLQKRVVYPADPSQQTYFSLIDECTTDIILAAGPSNFTTSGITSNSITCIWDQVTSADSYKIYISTTSGSFTSPIDINSKTTTTKLFSGLNPSTTYYFQIVSVKDSTLSAPATTNATTLAATPAPTTKQINLFPITGPPIPTSLTYPGQSTLSISIAKNKLPNTFSLVRLTVTNAAKNRVITQPNKKRQQTVSGSTATINISFNLFTVASGNSITFEKIQLEGRNNNKWYTIGYRKRVTYYVP